jgi:hypothetical protein
MRPHVSVGRRYRMEDGEIEVDSILPIGLEDITPELARASGFKGVVDLLKIAKHGKGEQAYLVRFHFVPPGSRPPAARGRNEPTHAQGQDTRTGASSSVGVRCATIA